MVINRRDIKRKRKDNASTCSLLDDGPKRTKVHAQRKFAQGSNVSSPVITPVKEIEKQEKIKPDVLPEPQELLPMNRPHTEDFLTFLCFRGTTMLPPSLNFFNAAPVDSREHTQPLQKEPISMCPPLNISARATPGTSERPFIAFGVRKRADPVLVSKHMDKKRRHALALQALRRKYQEQKMAKIRAVTISKLSEKITSKTLVRTRSVTKSETVTKKPIPQKTRVKIVTTKHVKVAARTAIKTPIRTTLTSQDRSQVKKRMCLRSFRGRFIQHELKMKKPKKKKKPVKIIKKGAKTKVEVKKKKETSSEFSSDDDQPLVKTVKVIKPSNKVPLPKITKKCATITKKPMEISFRVTRAHPLLASGRDQTIKRKIQIARSTIAKTPYVKLTPPKNISPKQKLKEEKAKLDNSSPRTRRAEEERLKKEPAKKVDRELRKTADKPETTTDRDLRRKPEREHATVQKDLKKKTNEPEASTEKESKGKSEKSEDTRRDLRTKTDKHDTLEKDSKRKPEKPSAPLEKEKKKPEKLEIVEKKKLQQLETTVKKKFDKPEVIKKDVKKSNKSEDIAKKEPDKPVLIEDTKKKVEKCVTTETDTKKKGEKSEEIPSKDTKKKIEDISIKDAKKKTETNLAKETKKKIVDALIRDAKNMIEETTIKDSKKKIENHVEKDTKKKTENILDKDVKKKIEEIAVKDAKKKTEDSLINNSKEKIEDTAIRDTKKKIEDASIKDTKNKIYDNILNDMKNKTEDNLVKDSKKKTEDNLAKNPKNKTEDISVKDTKQIEKPEVAVEKDLKRKLDVSPEIDSKKTPVVPIEKDTKKTSLAPIEEDSKKTRFASIEGDSKKIPFAPIERDLKKTSFAGIEGDLKQTPFAPVEGDSKATPVLPMERDSKKILVAPIEEDSKNTPFAPIEGVSKKTPVTPTEGDSKKTPFAPIEGVSKKTPVAPTEKDSKKLLDVAIEKDAKLNPESLTGKDRKKKPDISLEQEPTKELVKQELTKEKEPKKKSETTIDSTKKKTDKQVPEKDVKKKPEKREAPVVEEPRISQRPSRKTKEAAAIYMEILGHKLVSEGDMDEDNISIDSFPELPNVRKTEQRENELKAQAKSKNMENNSDAKAKVEEKMSVTKAKTKKLDKADNIPSENESKIANIKKPKVEELKNVKENEKPVVQNQPKNKKSDIFSDSDSSVKKNKMLKTSDTVQPKQTSETLRKKPENTEVRPRRRSGYSKSMIDFSLSESDESFTSEPNTKVKRPANSLSIAKLKTSERLKNSMKTKSYRLEDSDSESDESTTSKTSKTLIKTVNKSKKIKLTKVAKAQKVDNSFSDSDEEPLSKLTSKYKPEENKDKVVSEVKNQMNSANETVKQKLPETPVVEPRKGVPDQKVPGKKESLGKQTKKEVTQKNIKGTVEKQKPEEQSSLILSGKPKRECTKRPQNYLPLFSSSEDEDKYFHGFIKGDNAKQSKSTKVQETKCQPAPTADLLCKDVDKRFGKGKVNMSTEQIEKWLKDSAMAGSVKKETDDLLKFEEKPPAEVVLDLSSPSRNADNPKPPEKTESSENLNVKTESVVQPAPTSEIDAQSSKPRSLDKQAPSKVERKMIFRKERKLPMPNVNAFSPNNESSVYAFEADNEDAISTPFRRPTRRPSSTATSRSEDSSKYEESSKTAKFRLPTIVKQDPVKHTNKQEVSLMLSTEDSNNSTSIAVQLDIDSAEVVNTESTAQTEDGEQLFYIPLQPGKQSSSQVIQGVAVKLGTKGVNGPNQRVVMSAKLVTHTPLGAQKLMEKPLATSTPMYPPPTMVQKPKMEGKTFVKGGTKASDRMSENSEELKYKVPSSPSASSSSSTKVTKRQYIKTRIRPLEFCNPINASEFPSSDSPAVLLEAPIFHPSEKEFQDPLEYIEKIRPRAEKFGICRIVPPSNFKPECKVSDDMRFTAYNQYVHKMLHRWGPNFKELMAITKYLETQNIALTHPPWIGGMEIDLPRLYQIVQSLGGLKEVIEKKKWPKVSELMKIPRSAQDRVTKLDDIYCKYLLPYDTLSPAEREKLFDEVETEWAKRESRTLLKSQQKIINRDASPTSSESDSNDESEECIVKGRNMALNAFYRIARNTMTMWFKTMEPSAQEVEQEFWKHVTVKQNHICVHSGSIDSGNWGYGFAVSKNSPFARHAWNLKVLTNNSGSVLRSMGPVMGVTVPTLHVGMVFSACCWYRDPHSLPWIEYLHTGGNKIWYGIPDSMSEVFHAALIKMVPNYCRNKSLWLPSDTAMVPPSLLVEHGVSLCRTIQEPGQFVVVFPKAFTSSLCTGYVVSESVYFAPLSWLMSAQKMFDELHNSCEPPMFSLEKLLISIANDLRSSVDVLRQVIAAIESLREKEKSTWAKLQELGLSDKEKLPVPDVPVKKKKRLQEDGGDYECEACCRNLFISWIIESQEDAVYCLEHAMEYIEKKKIEVQNCKLFFTYDDQELTNLIEKMKSMIEAKLQKHQKHSASKNSGAP